MALRIALFSDTHGNLAALTAVLDALARHRPLHLVVAAGDHALADPRPAETWDALVTAGCACILGNEDEHLWDDRHTVPHSPWAPLVQAQLPATVAALGPVRLAALRSLPRSLRLVPAPGQDLLIVHANIHSIAGHSLTATSSDAELEERYGGANARVVCCGHYHEANLREWRGMTLVNVASVSLARDGQPLAGYTILDWDGAWQIAQYRVPFDAAAEERAFAVSSIPNSVPGWSRPSAT